MSSRPARLLSAFVLMLALAIIAGCSSGGDSTSPTPPVTGPTFSVSFPAALASQQITFTDVGTWTYHCIPHGTAMSGNVVVLAGGSPDSQVVSIQGGVGIGNYSPPTATIHQGGYVRWVNNSGFNGHTVTRP
jgi:hypothetical protein